MRDIRTNAILFDMYYMGKSPGDDDVNSDASGVPVTEATPQFRNFHVENVVCNGAEKAIQIRGLPEMNIKNIQLENLVLKTNKGVEITEATGISLKNVRLDCKDTNPLVSIKNSSNIAFDQLTYARAQLLFSVSGKNSSQIKVAHTDLAKAVMQTVFGKGAGSHSLTIVK